MLFSMFHCVSRHKFLQLEVTHVVGGDDEGWLRINVTHVVEMWTLFFHSNMGLYMHVLNSQGTYPLANRGCQVSLLSLYLCLLICFT